MARPIMGGRRNKQSNILRQLQRFADELHNKFSKTIGVEVLTKDFDRILLEKSILNDTNEYFKLCIQGSRRLNYDFYVELRDAVCKICPELLSEESASAETCLWFMLAAFVPNVVERQTIENEISDLRKSENDTFVNETIKSRLSREDMDHMWSLLESNIPEGSKRFCNELVCLLLDQFDMYPVSKMYAFWEKLCKFAVTYLTKCDGTLTLLQGPDIRVTLEIMTDEDKVSGAHLSALMAFLNCIIGETSGCHWQKNGDTINGLETDGRRKMPQKDRDTKLFFDVFCRAVDEPHDTFATTNISSSSECGPSKVLFIGSRHVNCQAEMEKFRYQLAMIRGFLQVSDRILSGYDREGRIADIASSPSPWTTAIGPSSTSSLSAASSRTVVSPEHRARSASPALMSSDDAVGEHTDVSPTIQATAKAVSEERKPFAAEEGTLQLACTNGTLALEEDEELARFMVSDCGWLSLSLPSIPSKEQVYCRPQDEEVVRGYLHNDSLSSPPPKGLFFVGDVAFADYVRDVLQNEFGWENGDEEEGTAMNVTST